MSEKELPPTPEKIREAREKGQLAVSQDLVSLIKLALVVELAFGLESSIRQAVTQLLDVAFLYVRQAPVSPFAVRLSDLSRAAVPLGVTMLVLAFVAAGASWLATLVQTQFNIAPKVFEEGLKKLDPVSNLKQIFSGQKLMMLALGPLKIGSVMVVVGWEVWSSVPLALQADRLAPMTLWAASFDVLHGMGRTALLVMLVWAIFDVALQRWMHLRNLRMSKEEVKQEYKNAEGDPHAKSFRKSTGKEVLMSEQVNRKPSVVVVNPEHFAVALAYDYKPESVPIIVGKGVDAEVAAWREVAQRQRIPVIRYRTLARQLYATGKVGEYVPSQALAAVALLFQAALEAAQDDASEEPGALYELDEEMAAEMLATAPRTGRGPAQGFGF